MIFGEEFKVETTWMEQYGEGYTRWEVKLFLQHLRNLLMNGTDMSSWNVSFGCITIKQNFGVTSHTHNIYIYGIYSQNHTYRPGRLS